MKIINLLNKIANGEEVPTKIQCLNYIWTYEKGFSSYKNYEHKDLIQALYDGLTWQGVLNKEVEILKENNNE